MTVRDFREDRSGMSALVTAVEQATVPRLTEAIFDDSQDYVPVLSGDLKATGRTEYHGGTGYVVYGGEAPSGEDVDYAPYQEVGTSKMEAQPYLRPAAYRVRSL